jgi:hypothetical protein
MLMLMLMLLLMLMLMRRQWLSAPVCGPAP